MCFQHADGLLDFFLNSPKRRVKDVFEFYLVDIRAFTTAADCRCEDRKKVGEYLIGLDFLFENITSTLSSPSKKKKKKKQESCSQEMLMRILLLSRGLKLSNPKPRC
jgi:hypothetical protein